MDNVLEAKNINKHFLKPKDFHVLKDISFAIKQGEFASIMGKSGSGKSTLLYILSTMDTDYTGELFLNNELVTGRLSTELSRIAIQKLKMLGIEQLAKQKASRISGGEKQRVAIARALINNPSILMGDEPTGNLDSYNSDNVFNIFKQLKEEEGLSLLVVTHDEDFAKRTDYIIQMEDGRIMS